MINRVGIEITELDTILLQNFLFWREQRRCSLRLSIGAPSSPLISNFVMYFFDEEIKLACDEKGINYTRYADDLTFSTNTKNILIEMPDLVACILKSNSQGLIKVNKNKTIFSSKAYNRHVTGVTLTNDDKLSIGRDRKRLISSMIHKFTLEALDQESTLKLQGLISFANHIESNFFQRMCRKYGEENLIKIMKYRVVE